MARATQAIIDLSAIEQNYRLAKKQAPEADAYAVIKANAYGHGLVDVGLALSEIADGLAVACVDEAEQLRDAGVLSPIMVLEGAYDEEECQQAASAQLELVLHQHAQLDWLKSIQSPLRLWIKVDTGMHRLGFQIHEVEAVLNRLSDMAAQSGVKHELALMSHFACADQPSESSNQSQLQAFSSLSKFNLPMSMSNSAAILSCSAAHGQRLRPGIMLYGSSPILDQSAESLCLQPAMTLTSEIIALHDLQAGESVGYGNTWTAEKDCRIAVVAIGYGDGYPRMAPNGTPILVKGQRAALAGRVSMDMITVDVSAVSDVQLGDEVELWGEHLPADEIAQACQTIAYELFCQVTSRVPRFYKR